LHHPPASASAEYPTHPEIAMPSYDDAAPVTVLIVCARNVCRSPLYQSALTTALASIPWLNSTVVTSAGLDAHGGETICAVVADRLDAQGESTTVAEFRSTEITPGLIQAATLVLTAERDQRSAVNQLAPGEQHKTFTMLEAAQLAVVAEHHAQLRPELAPTDLGSLVDLLHDMRGLAALDTAPITLLRANRRPVDRVSIADGHGLSERRHAAVLDAVEQSVHDLARSLRAMSAAVPA
jgi:protein-tyrosine phosphatase